MKGSCWFVLGTLGTICMLSACGKASFIEEGDGIDVRREANKTTISVDPNFGESIAQNAGLRVAVIEALAADDAFQMAAQGPPGPQGREGEVGPKGPPCTESPEFVSLVDRVDEAADRIVTLESALQEAEGNEASLASRLQRIESLLSALDAQIQTDVVAARYSGNPPSANFISPDTWSLVTFPETVFDTHSAYSSGVYTVPTNGKYFVSANVGVIPSASYGSNELVGLAFFRNGEQASHGFERTFSGQQDAGAQVNGVLDLVAGDEIDIRIYSQQIGTSFIINPVIHLNYFSIARVGL